MLIWGGHMEDVFYFSRRVQEEREAAVRASNTNVRKVHLQLADGYDAKVRGLVANSRQSLKAVHAA
jgi:hypothetical protein